MIYPKLEIKNESIKLRILNKKEKEFLIKTNIEQIDHNIQWLPFYEKNILIAKELKNIKMFFRDFENVYIFEYNGHKNNLTEYFK